MFGSSLFNCGLDNHVINCGIQCGLQLCFLERAFISNLKRYRNYQ